MTEEISDPIRIITLTSAAPVHIRDRDWPIAAHVKELERGYEGAPHERSVWIKVRVHEDGRSIVYGGRIGECTIRCGELVAPDGDPIGAITSVANVLHAPRHLARQLIAQVMLRSKR